MKVAGGKLGETKRTHRIGSPGACAPAGRKNGWHENPVMRPAGARGVVIGQTGGCISPAVETSHRLPSSAPLGPMVAPPVFCYSTENSEEPPLHDQTSSNAFAASPNFVRRTFILSIIEG